jgi:protein-S-isoprenylcysteine O-methyltransferase Ste14
VAHRFGGSRPPAAQSWLALCPARGRAHLGAGDAWAALDDADHRPAGRAAGNGRPYRFISHPNYVVVTAEIAVLPLVFGLWPVALIFSALNAAMLAIRIREESRSPAKPRLHQ